MGRLKKPATQDRFESILAPADSYQIACAPTLERLRALKGRWTRRIVVYKTFAARGEKSYGKQEQELQVTESLRVYNRMLMYLTVALRSLDKVTEAADYLTQFSDFTKKKIEAPRVAKVTPEYYATNQRLGLELLTALEDFS